MSEALRILILEDRSADAELVTRELRKAGFEFVAKTATTESEFLAELRDRAPQLILADYSLPGYDGLSALAAAHEHCPEVPFIFVSGSMGEEKAIEALHQGATDYVLKQRLARLGPAVRRALRERAESRMGQQAQERIRELNLVLRATGAINALMVRERDPERLLAEACKILVETRGYLFVWIGQVEPGSKRVVPAARAGNDDGYLDTVTVTWDETPTGRGPIGTAIRTGQPVTCQDLVTDPLFAPWREAAVARGVASVAAMPMVYGARALGAVAVYSGRTGAFHGEELELLKELAADLAFALQSIEHERERRWAEESLGESERRFRLLFNSGHDAVFVHQGGSAGGGSGRFIEVNDIACKRLGYTREELLQMTPRDISAPETLPDIPRIRAKLARDKSAVSEGVHLTKDGRRIPVEISTHEFELNGQPTRLSMVRDITERRKGEESLRKSELFAKSVLNSLTAHIAVVDAPGTIVAVNDAWRRFARENHSRDPAAYVGANYLAVCQKSVGRGEHGFAEAALRELHAVLRGEQEEFSLEYPCHAPDQQRWFKVRATRFSGEGNARMVVAHENITERKQLEEALRESSQFNQEIVASVQEGITVYGRDLKYQVWNQFMERLSGMPADQVLGKHPDELFPFLREGGVLAAIQKALAGEPTSSIELPFEDRRAGKSGWSSHKNGPLRNAAGEIVGVIGIVRDITERKRAELRIVAFANLGQRLNAVKTAREAGEIIVAVADELLGWDACLFDLYSAAENRMTHLLSMDLIDGRRTECTRLDLDPSPREVPRRVIEQGGQLILRDDPKEMRPEGAPFGDMSRLSASLMFVPIRNGPEVVGVLSIQSYTPRAYDAGSLETLQALADYGGGALERLRAQEALNESEATFRSVWERSIDGMRLADKEGRIIAVNEAFCRLVKLPREKLEGQIFSVAYKGHGPNDGIEVYQKRFATGSISPRDTRRVQLWNSEAVDIEISSSFIELGQRGKMLLSIFRDVSERKRAELRVEAFSNLGHRLSATNTAREAAGIISEVASKMLGWDACSFSLLSPSGELLNHVLQVDTIEGRRVECSSGYEPPSALARRAIEAGGQLILKGNPGQMLPGAQPFGGSARPSAAIMYVPIRKGAEVIGVMTIQSYTPGAYDSRSLETLQALADHCGGALDRLRMEEALRASEVRYRRLFESAKDGVLILDAQTGMVVDVNPFLVKLLGFSREAFFGKKVWELGFFKDLLANEANFVELQQKEYVLYEDKPLETSDGRRIEVEFVSNVYLVNHQKVIQCNIRDISARKRAEAELKRSHEQYRRAIASANAIPYQKMYGTETYAFMGEGIKELTGYAPDELRSKVWQEIILETVFLGEAAGLPLAEAARRTLAGEIKHWRADHRIRTRSGAIRWISDSSVQLRDANGKRTGSMGIIQDITERKALEEQLRQSQKMEAVGQLAGGVAHDFNNMLAVIRGNAELLLMEEAQFTTEARQGLKYVVEASERASNLTRQLLTFSRKQVMQPQPLVLNDVIANLTKMLNRVLRENIDLRCDYAEPLPCIQADTGMMEQVVLNLVVNARDAMPAGGQLRVATERRSLDEAHARVHPEARAGEFVCLAVSDTGTGIAPEILPRIFEPFFTTKEIGKGTGLGLATVYGIVQQHRGWIEVSSRVGEGTTFKVFLPALPAPASPAAAEAAGADVRGGQETILLVEDEDAVRLTTRRILESKGYTIREATNAREALELWEANAGGVTLLLTDIMMPGEMTGRDLAERLWKQRPGLKVIFMSGYSAEVLGKGTDFIRRTRSYFLQKPGSSRTLLETVRHCLDEKAPDKV